MTTIPPIPSFQLPAASPSSVGFVEEADRDRPSALDTAASSPSVARLLRGTPGSGLPCPARASRASSWHGHSVMQAGHHAIPTATPSAYTPSYLQATTPRPPIVYAGSSPERPPRRIVGVVQPSQYEASEASLTNDIKVINDQILAAEMKSKDAGRVVYWLQVAGVVISVVAPILGLFLAWWAVLPLIAVGAALYLISWYFSHIENKHLQEINPLSTQKEQKNHELLPFKMMEAYKNRTAVAEAEFKETFQQFCGGIEAAVSPYAKRLSLHPDIQRAMKRLGVDAPRRCIRPLKSEELTAKEAFLVDKAYFARDTEALSTLKYLDYTSSISELSLIAQEKQRKALSLVEAIKKKEESAHKASMTSFWLRIAGVVAGVAGPLLAMITAPWVAIPFVLLGIVTYFLSWHFTARQVADLHDIAAFKTEGRLCQKELKSDIETGQALMDKERPLVEAARPFYDKWHDIVTAAELQSSLIRPSLEHQTAAKAAKEVTARDKDTSYALQTELAEFVVMIVQKKAAHAVLDHMNIEWKSRYGTIASAYTYDPIAMAGFLELIAQKEAVKKAPSLREETAEDAAV